jgi:MFS family permease
MANIPDARSSSRPFVSVTGAMGDRIAAWTRAPGSRRVGGLVLVLAALVTLATYLLRAALTYPTILLDPAPLAQALVAQKAALIVLGFLGLLLSGGLLAVIAIALASELAPPVHRRMVVTGAVAGSMWAMSALVGLALLPLWGHAPAGVTAVLAALVLLLGEIAAPLLLAVWTVMLSLQLQVQRVLGWVGAIGLVLGVARALLWLVNEPLPVASGLYGPAEILDMFSACLLTNSKGSWNLK